MRKALVVIIALLVFSAYSHAYQMKNPVNRFDAALAFNQAMNTGLQFQGTFNMNESFYVGVRFTTGGQIYYYSAVSRASDTAYLLDFSNVALLLGLQFGAFNERFNCYFNLMPGFGFGSRQTGTRAIGTGYTEMFSAGLTNVTKTVDQSFFSPSVELGFNCQLTENLILSTGWLITAVGISDAPWEHYPWFIKLSETDALVFSIPVRLSWRF